MRGTMSEHDLFQRQRELIRTQRQAVLQYNRVKKEAEARRRDDHAAAKKALQRAQQARKETEQEAQRQYNAATQAAQDAYEEAQATAAEYLERAQAARNQGEQILSEYAVPLSFPEVTYTPDADTDAQEPQDQLAAHVDQAEGLVDTLRQAVDAWRQWRKQRARRARRLRIAGAIATVLLLVVLFLSYYQVRHTLYRRAFEQALQTHDWSQASQTLMEWRAWAMGAPGPLDEPLWGPFPWEERYLLEDRLTDEITQAMQEQDWQRAQVAARVLQQWDRVEGGYFLGQIAMDQGKWEEARRILEELLARDKGDEKAQEMLRETYYRPARAAMEAGQWEEARRILEELLARDKGDEKAQEMLRETYYRPAQAAMEAGQWEEARRILEELLARDKGDEKAQAMLLETYYRSAQAAIEGGQWEEARRILKELLARDKGNEKAREMLLETFYRPAQIAMENSRWEEARRIWEELLTQDEGNQEAQEMLLETYHHLAQSAMAADQWEKAKDYLEKAHEIDPHNQDVETWLKEAYYRVALMARQQKDWSKARENLEKLSRLDPDYKDDTPDLLFEAIREENRLLRTAQFYEAQQNLPDLLRPLHERFDMLFTYVPPGKFIMGSPDGEGDSDEHPQHTVSLDGFWIGLTEVTNAQYKHFIEAGGYEKPRYWTKAGWRWRQEDYITQPRCWDYERWNRADYPVVCVSWYEAVAFTRWLSEETGLTVRLPTEAEWEKAARGTDGRRYPWGDEFKCGMANTDKDCGPYDPFGYTAPIGSFPAGASPYGALDMAGNVWEWTSSLYKPYPYWADDGREDPDASGRRVVRGGSWGNGQRHVRAAARSWGDPDFRIDSLGFRVLVAAPEE